MKYFKDDSFTPTRREIMTLRSVRYETRLVKWLTRALAPLDNRAADGVCLVTVNEKYDVGCAGVQLSEQGLQFLRDFTMYREPGVCRVCGCHDHDCQQCFEALGQPCSWIEGDPSLCTACATDAQVLASIGRMLESPEDDGWPDVIEDFGVIIEVRAGKRPKPVSVTGNASIESIAAIQRYMEDDAPDSLFEHGLGEYLMAFLGWDDGEYSEGPIFEILEFRPVPETEADPCQ